MCGIIAIVRRRTDQAPPDASDLMGRLDAVAGVVLDATDPDLPAVLDRFAIAVAGVDADLRGEAGLAAMLDAGLVDQLRERMVGIDAELAALEAALDAAAERTDTETVNARLIAAKDAVWSLLRDRVRTADEVAAMLRPGAGRAAIASMLSVQQALSALDRLEVRGRDSAGLQLLVRDHGLDLTSADLAGELARRSDPLFTDRAVSVVDGMLAFVYKAAAEIGELGDNTASMRAGIVDDDLLAAALMADTAETVVLGHTRWASVGIISEPNAHPVNSDETDGEDRPYAAAVLNGDVDNFGDLIAADGLCLSSEITTDAKVIPTMVARAMADGHDLDESVRRTVAQFEGSVAIGISTDAAPEDLHIALRGSGQGVFIGLADDAFVVASEPYGVVEDSTLYLRMDGETPSDPENPSTSQGQIIRLRGDAAGTPEGLERFSYDGSALPVAADEWATPEVTTRDIDRGDAPHYLFKEINESPNSFRKTLRGRLVDVAGDLEVRLPPETLSAEVLDRLRSGDIRRVEVIGQGTAAIGGQAVAAAFEYALQGTEIPVRAIIATELSGFNMRQDMSDALVVAISQSGTTTDTNRTVDLVRSRGALVVAIVNRRGSDLADKADGVLYTSDGRDVEMSVASTKAFYAQIAAGFLLAHGVADLLGAPVNADRQAVLTSLRAMPEAMTTTIGLRPQITVAARHALKRRYWAMVGNGANLIAAREIRIKLSELCYKSIACDVTEDKKHIDLSSEPLIFIGAAGLTGSNADDVAKEVAIFRAHKAAPIVVATEGEHRFDAALEVIAVPEVHPRLAFVLTTMVGHLFGYEAALAIDASARPLREARAVIEKYVTPTGDWFVRFNADVAPYADRFMETLRTSDYDGHLEAGTATRLAGVFRYAAGIIPLEHYQAEFGKVGTPGTVAEDLNTALTAAIEELTRPVDAIKHQAKTVTVGISRSDESLLQADLIQAVLDTGCGRDRLSYRSLRTLAAVDPAITDVVGYTRYSIDGNPDEGATLQVIDTGGVATRIPSRTEKDPSLRGTKHRVAVEREPFVTVGSDGRTVLIVPEVKGGVTTGLTLCHLVVEPSLTASTARAVLQGYRNRYRQLVDVVTETEPTFRDDLLADVPTVDLLTAPISDVASRWARS